MRSSTPGPPPANVAAACATWIPWAAVIWPTPRPNSTRARISSCGIAGVEFSVMVGLRSGADQHLRGHVAARHLGDDVDGRIGAGATVEGDPAAGDLEALAE